MEDGLDYFFRYIDGELTEEEKMEESRLSNERDKLKKSTNQYCACGGDVEGKEILSLDSH